MVDYSAKFGILKISKEFDSVPCVDPSETLNTDDIARVSHTLNLAKILQVVREEGSHGYSTTKRAVPRL